MLRFSPRDPELTRLFKTYTYRYYIQPLRARDLPGFVSEVEKRLGITGLSRSGSGDPAAYIGTADAPEAHPIYWQR